jgi:hypothetical protein
MFPRRLQSGFTLVEALIVIAISVLIFAALFAAFEYSLKLIAYSRAKTSAQSLANQRLEHFRSLPYDDVGTISGIPPGTIPQNSTTTLNGIVFFERVLVEYVDDDADGLGASDSNGIVSDYKRLKVEYSWNIHEATSSIAIISNIVPRSVETTAGGGTVRINVIDADASLLPGATVRLVNTTLTPSIDVTRYTDSSGAALFSGAPAGGGYEVYVTANISGDVYSTAQTYQVTAGNPTPVLAPFAVLEADISTLTLQIGALSDLDMYAYSSRVTGATEEDFADLASVDSSTNVSTVGSELVLQDVAGVYSSSGSVYIPIVPTSLSEWGTIRVAADVPSNTSYLVRAYTGDSVSGYTLIPDSELTGNAAGLGGTLIDISELDPVTYPQIMIGVALSTGDTSITPQIDELGVYYIESESALGSLAFDIRGEKIIGTRADASKIYKYDESFTTNGSGFYGIDDLEFDLYTFTFPSSYVIEEACSLHPFTHQAGVDGEVSFLLGSDPNYSLRVSVVDASGRPVPGSQIEISRAGFSDSTPASLCGQAFFGTGIGAHDDYAVTVNTAGYNTETVTAVSVDGNDAITVVLTES